MKQIQIKNYILILFLLLTLQVQSQGFLKASGQEIVNENGEPYTLKGMGLGGWMLQEGYMLQTSGFANAQHEIKAHIEELIGPADTELFYDAWLANHVTKRDIDSLKSWGFNSVRLPMHYNLFTLPIEEEPVEGENTWLTEGFEMTDNLISWCAQNQMYVILDLHAAPGGQGKDAGISDYDPDKPSLWESKANRDKTVALWKKLAERYVNEPWVGGYDLINETNWEMSGNIPLRDLYYEITDSIRKVDTNHIIFIEGNWFANDFTGLTPPWDDNMVYSPHKYWSFNDQNSIQWVLDIRENYDVPIYFGETGENSNTWFTDAIVLFEEHNLGWAWWPMKKIESIAGPLSAIKTPEYQVLLDYWNGIGEKPSAAYAKSALMATADNMKIENCIYQKDVIDAMFRQPYTDATIPYETQQIPGIVYSTDFDMGIAGSAYFDTDIANYQVSTGNYTAWNRGWAYRNDGIDIEVSEDNVNSNGYNIGFVAAGEWMQYDVEVAASAVYEVKVRVASETSGGSFHFGVDDADVSDVTAVPSTGGWQEWQTVTIPKIILTPSDEKLRFLIDKKEFNLGSFEFIQKGASTSVATEYLSSFTLDNKTIQLNVNKPLTGPLPNSPADFTVFVNGNQTTITQVEQGSNARIVTIEIDHVIKSSEEIKVSYTGSEIMAQDGTLLEAFSLKVVQNNVAITHAIPGKIQAEDFFDQSGIELEDCTDEGGGQNIGYLDEGDYCDYYIDVAQNGTYKVDYRTSSESAGGAIQLQLIDDEGEATTLHSASFPATGGWQTWETTSKNLSLTAGQHRLRLLITQSLFNVNWFQFTFLTSIEEQNQIADLNIFPNPFKNTFTVKGTLKSPQKVRLEVYNSMGQQLYNKAIQSFSSFDESIDLSKFSPGNYYLTILLENGDAYREKLILAGD